jgi:hypothetical protein
MEDQDLLTVADAAQLAGRCFLYDYDLGDGWRHLVEVEQILPSPTKLPLPVCIDGARCCPPEDCGGPDGCQELIAATKDSHHPRHRELCDWLDQVFGPTWTFDPDRFDLDLTNKALAWLAKEEIATRGR